MGTERGFVRSTGQALVFSVSGSVRAQRPPRGKPTSPPSLCDNSVIKEHYPFPGILPPLWTPLPEPEFSCLPQRKEVNQRKPTLRDPMPTARLPHG